MKESSIRGASFAVSHGVVSLEGLGQLSLMPWDAKHLSLANSLSPRLSSLKWVAKNQPDALPVVLFVFAKKQQGLVAGQPELLPVKAWSVMTMIPVLDQMRVELEVGWDSRTEQTWEHHLYAAVDEVVHSLWFLRAGQLVPAALIARGLLERWTHNVAHQFGKVKDEGELDDVFMSRVWSSYVDKSLPSEIGQYWSWLSEILHGRAGGVAFGLEASEALSLNPSENTAHAEIIITALEVSLRQIRGAFTATMLGKGQREYVPYLQAPSFPVDSFPEPFSPLYALFPLDHYSVYGPRADQWVELAQIYRENVVRLSLAPEKVFDPLFAFEAFMERRGRIIENSRESFAMEQGMVGDEYVPSRLSMRLFRYSSITQMTRLLSRVSKAREGEALVIVSQALDGAAEFWLQDSDHSISSIRVLLEQISRLKAHRCKPEKAESLEKRSRSSAARWLELAGWKRLSVLMRIGNEFTHIGPRTRRAGAREALNRLQIDEEDPHTARGNALDHVVYMLVLEILARLESYDSDLADSFRKFFVPSDKPDASVLEKYLDKATTLKSYDFGAPDYVRPVAEEDVALKNDAQMRTSSKSKS